MHLAVLHCLDLWVGAYLGPPGVEHCDYKYKYCYLELEYIACLLLFICSEFIELWTGIFPVIFIIIL